MTQSETDKHTTGHAAENLWSFCPRNFTYEFHLNWWNPIPSQSLRVSKIFNSLSEELPYILGTFLLTFSTHLGLSKSRVQVPKSPMVVHVNSYVSFKL